MDMDHPQEHGRHAFIVGMLAGTCIGAGLAVWLAPQGASEVGQRLSESTKGLASRAIDGLRVADWRVGDTTATVAGNAQDVRHDRLVAGSAHEAEQYARAVISGRR